MTLNVAQLNAVRAQLQGQLSSVFDDIERLNGGVALSLAMESPAIPDGANFAVSGGIGYFQREHGWRGRIHSAHRASDLVLGRRGRGL